MTQSAWPLTRLGDVAHVLHGWPFRSESYAAAGIDLPIVVAIGNFEYSGGFRFERSTVKRYTGEYPDEYELDAGDLLLVMTCQTEGGEILGVPGRVPDDGRTYLHNQRIGRLVIDQPDAFDADFAFQLARTADFNRQLCLTATGSKILHTAPKRIEATTFRRPPIKEQRAIAEVLGALDDKIAANIRLASTTENLLHASFRAGVSVGSCDLVRVEDIVKRLQIPRRFRKDEILAVGDFPVLDQSEDGMLGFLNGDKFIEATEEAPVLYFGDHTCKLRISSEKFLVGPNTIPFIGAGVPSVVLFCALQGLQPPQEYRRHWQSLMKKETSIPHPTWCADFASKFKVFLTLLASAKRENSILATTRDSLLPQMMSGKIRVKDAAQMVGDVV